MEVHLHMPLQRNASAAALPPALVALPPLASKETAGEGVAGISEMWYVAS